MSQALVLVPRAMSDLAPPRAERVMTAPRAHAAFVYGDSTPFPYDADYVNLTSAFVDCCVAVMRSHGAIVAAHEAEQIVTRRAAVERARLTAMGEAVGRALAASAAGAPERITATASAIADAASSNTKGAIDASAAERDKKLATVAALVREARRRASAAFAEFFRDHELPGAEVGVRLDARDDRYDVDAQVATRSGLVTTFEAKVTESHAWRRPRKVAELSERLSIRLPRKVGLLSKRIESRPTKLGSLYVARVIALPDRSELTLRKKPDAGRGWNFVFGADGVPVSARSVGDDGVLGDAALVVGQDAAELRALWRRVVATTADLAEGRRAMRFASCDATSIDEHDDLESIVARMVGELAPVVREIARRAGAPGELVLRREVAAWRREEIYATTAELSDRIATLPPGLREVFAPLGLSEPPRSPRAPRVSVVSYAEISVADFLPA